MQKYSLILLIFILLPFNFFGQTHSISGLIIDSLSKEPLVGVSVSLSNNRGTITNKQGVFVLSSSLFNENKRKSLTISYIGYRSLIYQLPSSSDRLVISIAPLEGQLQEVVVSTRAKSIIEKAIEKIPVNYPITPININGILRVNTSVNDTDYFYKSDAAIKVYAESYDKGSSQKVKVETNKTTVLKNPKSKYFDFAPANFAGNFSSISDVVYHKDLFLSKSALNNYLFYQKEKILLNNRVTHVFNFEKKKNNKIEGVVYIDSASLAFVKFSIRLYQVKSLIFITKDFVSADIDYQLLGNKWIINSSHLETIYEKKVMAKEYVDFLANSYDTVEIKKITTFEAAGSIDVDYKVQMFSHDSNWRKYDTLFIKAEKEEKLATVEIPIIDTTIAPKKNLIRGFGQYLNNDNIRMNIYFSKLPYSLRNTVYNGISTFGIGTGISLRIYKPLFFQFNSENVWGWGGLNTKYRSYNLSYEWLLFNKTNRGIGITPFVGYSNIVISDATKNMQQRFMNIVAGLYYSIQLKKRINFFVGSEATFKLKEQTNKLGISPNMLSTKSGLIIRL